MIPHSALAFVDLDDLGSLNDLDESWEDGDKALCGVAAQLSEQFGHEYVARWGADEYLEFAPLSTAQQLVDSLQKVLGHCRSELVVSGRPITFSAGVTDIIDCDVEAARARAEKTVKRAKRSGTPVVIEDQ